MAHRCELTGKGPIVKNLLSHSHIKTKRWVKPNLQRRRLYSDTLQTFVTLSVAANTLRSIDHVGGFDQFIMRQPVDALSKRARAIRTRIRKARG